MASRPASRVLHAFLGLTGLAACLSTRVASADPVGDPGLEAPGPRATSAQPAPDELPPPSARWNGLIGGAATTAAWYGLALGSSYLWPDALGAKDLRIPVAGPWIAISHTGCGTVALADCSKVVVVLRAIATTLDAIGQAGGIAIMGQSLFLPTREREEAPKHSRLFEIHPTFDAGNNNLGFGVVGTF